MVHYVAKHCGNCKVLEINTSQIRSGAALKNAIEEATQSYSSSFTTIQQKEKQTNKKDATNSLFNATSNKKSRTIVDSDSDDSDSDDNNVSSSSTDSSSSDDDDHDDEKDNEKNDTNKSSVTVVLIDEVDILFDVEGDAGFWAALGSLAKSTKCPIILTANHCPSQLHNNNSLSCQRFQLERPTPIECSSKLLHICRTENLQFRPDLLLPEEDTVGEGEKGGSDSDNDNDAIRIQKQLSTIATSCHCDLRKMIQELQVFSCSASAIAIATATATARCRCRRR
mmetsp:Transcript_12771/g.14165  ORF Transcript_12771/g.14165 Transcript_12771/m.14165 type:complete len:282 (-) Transcript_12771:288-1133(-)